MDFALDYHGHKALVTLAKVQCINELNTNTCYVMDSQTETKMLVLKDISDMLTCSHFTFEL